MRDHDLVRYNPQESGKLGYALAWLVGVPIPVLLVIFLVAKAC
jgi:hypothetical protein